MENGEEKAEYKADTGQFELDRNLAACYLAKLFLEVKEMLATFEPRNFGPQELPIQHMPHRGYVLP